ncbi:PxKF domain-containing protein [Microbispora sp. CA-102843]|uniref:PxKF domain-containing protein n=1 Tax=Microbispora sp. CA-102843 TaxID=3239952 RepID=UPI003D8E6566
MSRPTVTASPSRRGRRGRLAVLAAVSAVFGLLAVAGPAHADSVVQMTGPAGPVPVDTGYTYTVDLPNTAPNPVDHAMEAYITLSGAAATFTAWQTSSPAWECRLQGTTAHCWELSSGDMPTSITLTVLPTAAGTVTAQASALSVWTGDQIGTDTTTTQVGNPTPAFPFTGFFQPVNNLPIVNTVNAGRAIPVKFSLGGGQGLDILATGSPSSERTACDGSTTDPIETTTASTSGLTYDAGSGQYTYVWKTDKAWAGTCRTLHLRLSDGTDHTAKFQFK